MDKFLEICNLQRRPNHKEIENLIRLLNNREIGPAIKNFPTNESPGSGELYQTFNKELMSILLKLFQKSEEVGTLLNSFYKVSTTLIPKPDKDTSRK